MQVRSESGACPDECPLDQCLQLLAGAWTHQVIWYLRDGAQRFGDLRRSLSDPATDVHGTRIEQLMTRTPVTIDADALAVEAAQLMETRKINALLVVDGEHRVVGALNIHDLLRARVV